MYGDLLDLILLHSMLKKGVEHIRGNCLVLMLPNEGFCNRQIESASSK